MKQLLTLCLLTSACGAVDEVPFPDGAASDAAATGPILLETPTAATTALALDQVSTADLAALHGFVSGRGDHRDVSEQRMTVMVDAPLTLYLSLEEPTGTFRRQLVMTKGTTGALVDGPTFLCSSEDDPRCNLAVPTAEARVAEGTLSQLLWTVRVLDEETGRPLSFCQQTTWGAKCELPAGLVGRVFRITTAMDRAWQAYDGHATIEVQNAEGRDFVGRRETTYLCRSSYSDGGLHCMTWNVYQRAVGIDFAELSFDPIEVSVQTTVRGSENEIHTAMIPSPPLTWHSGDADLPGAEY